MFDDDFFTPERKTKNTKKLTYYTPLNKLFQIMINYKGSWNSQRLHEKYFMKKKKKRKPPFSHAYDISYTFVFREKTIEMHKTRTEKKKKNLS